MPVSQFDTNLDPAMTLTSRAWPVADEAEETARLAEVGIRFEGDPETLDLMAAARRMSSSNARAPTLLPPVSSI